MKRNLLVTFLLFTVLGELSAQQLYADFEGRAAIGFGKSSGVLTPLISNPSIGEGNNSANCMKYVRDTTFYDNLVIYPDTVLENVNLYLSDAASAPKITMKLYTTAPVGTTILLQLGRRNDDRYPSGVYSEFIQHTTVQNAWETIVFRFYMIPEGSQTTADQVDKVVLLLDPASHATHTMYVDDLSGPGLMQGLSVLNEVNSFSSIKLFQNSPNPVKNGTHINFQLKTAGFVSLELFDVLGNPISSLLNKKMKAGIYSIPVETDTIPDGIYFYVLKTEEDSKSMRMIVSK